ncbi:MAG: CDP-diacylglycerol--glycerol-3-phosphate 3-phosphatidyltransferase [Ignavibacteriae bacterium]|nr:CDP-diacylglycerol--glycerol-3-phosphate 3-phosphatidyltransferase [Ignavibacteriota bacterium]
MTFPNLMSFVRIILSPVFLFLFLRGDDYGHKYLRILSVIVFFIAVLTDWYDGWHARKFKSVTKTGVFLDPFADKVLTTFAFALFYSLGIMPLWMFVIIALRDLLVTLLRSYDEYNGKTMKTSFISKLKTFFQMTYIFVVLFLLVLPSFGYTDTLKISDFLYDSPVNYIVMLSVTALTFYTGLIYFFERKFENFK